MPTPGWRRPVLIPLYALVASFLFVLVVGMTSVGGATTQTGVDDPPRPPDGAATPTAPPEFVAATDAKPVLRLTNGSPGETPPTVTWEVRMRLPLAADGADALDPHYEDARNGMPPLPPDTDVPIIEPLVDRLVCLRVADPTWAVAASSSSGPLITLSERGQGDEQTAYCQGGYADHRAVPGTLGFTVSKMAG